MHLHQAVLSSRLLAAICVAGVSAGLTDAEPAIAQTHPSPDRIQLAVCDSLHAAGRYADAFESAEALLEEVEARDGVESLAAAEVIDRILRARVMSRTTTPECHELATRALAIREAHLATDDPAIATSITYLGQLFVFDGDYQTARQHFERALNIRQESLTPDDPLIAETLVFLANLRARMGDYAGLEASYERALAIQEAAYGKRHEKVAGTLLNYAILRKLTGDYASARGLYERALDILQEVLGSDHPRVARIHHNLANVLVSAGDYEEARAAYGRALEIRELASGPRHPNVAQTLMGIAILMTRSGDFVGARDRAERALEIYEEALGPDHLWVGYTLATLASTRHLLGDAAGALPLLERALELQMAATGPGHPKVAEYHFEIAQAHQALGDLDAAEISHRRALAIREVVLPPNHPHTGNSRRALGEILAKRGELAEARDHLSRAVEIQEEAGTNLPLAWALGELGRVAWWERDRAIARSLLERSVEISAASAVTDHPQQLDHVVTLAHVLADCGDNQRAFELSLSTEAPRRRHLRLITRGLPEQQALRYASNWLSESDLPLSLLLNSASAESIARTGVVAPARGVWNELVQSRALILDEMAARQRVLGQSSDPATQELRTELAKVTGELAWLLVSSLGDDDGSEARREHYATVQRRKETIERQLAQRSTEFLQAEQRANIGLDDVVGALPAGSALVTYVRYRHYTPQSAGDSGARGGTTGIPSYAVLVWAPDRSNVTARALGAAVEIDLLTARWRNEAGYGARVPGRPATVSDRACRQAGERLRQRIWDPLEEQLSGCQQVFIVPDGTLHLINFAALPIGEDRFLVDGDLLIHCVSAERDLVALPPREIGPGALLAMGAPDFDADRAALTATDPLLGRKLETLPVAHTRGASSTLPGCNELAELTFAPLPASAVEVEEIAHLWKLTGATSDPQATLESSDAAPTPIGARPVSLLTGAAANETALKQLAGGYETLHLATHGFFLGDRCRAASPTERGVGGMRPVHGTNGAGSAINPLLLSGVALAGANSRHTAGPDDQDGLITAAEIAALDLAGVSWAVLSTCDSGLGETRAGEGVLGLRRAFQVAGARTVIMSLWSVSDEAARAWMTELYRGRLEEHLTTAEAVRRASRRVLAARRAADQSTHPYYWAGFIAAGDWR